MNNELSNNITKSLQTLEQYNLESEKELLDILKESQRLFIESAIIGGTIASLSIVFVVAGFILTNLI